MDFARLRETVENLRPEFEDVIVAVKSTIEAVEQFIAAVGDELLEPNEPVDKEQDKPNP